MATVVRCDICGSIHDDQDDNFKSVVRCNISDYIDFDICEECMNKIKVFCSDINVNYKNLLANDSEKA